MRSVGPFELTEAEFAGLGFVLYEDEKQRKVRPEISDPFIGKFRDTPVYHAFRLCKSRTFDDYRLDRGPNRLDPETGESGETAEAEAESALIERDLGLLKGRVNYHVRP